jgi:hypothetical protein
MKHGLLARAIGRLVPVLIGMAFYLPLSAQRPVSDVSGLVRNQAGQPLANVSVIARNGATQFTTGMQTDSNGIFRFTRLPVNGLYTFSFTCVGYEDQKLSGYPLQERETTAITIRLRISR